MAHAQIEGFDCSLYLDYDCQGVPVLSKLSPDGKITWLELRMNMIFLRPLQMAYDANSSAYKNLHDPEGSPPMTHRFLAASAVMNGIEALGSFLTGPNQKSNRSFPMRLLRYLHVHRATKGYKPNKPNFLAFIHQYMPPDWNQVIDAPHYGRLKLSEVLWRAYRNGLAHSFAIEHASLEDLPPGTRYEISGGLVRIDGAQLFADFVKATAAMFQAVRTNPKIKKTFLIRFDEVYRCDP